jgi:hypothetical protein
MSRRDRMRCLLGLAVASLCLASASSALAGAKAIIAQNGELKVTVVVGPAASERTRKAAANLASYLSRMTGDKCAVQEGDGRSGLAVGTPTDFSTLKLDSPQIGKDPTARENYLLRSHEQGVWLIGATELAVEHAVWDALHSLGYRQFFPGETWEVIPGAKELVLTVDRLEQPDYHARRIWYGFGAAPWAKEEYLDWCAKNRAVSGIEINSGHAYDGILRRHEKEFAAHPEYLALVNGERGGARAKKFCIANAGLRDLVVQDTLKQFADNPTRDCVSLDPSDGGGWCECEECRKLGSVSDRALTLANQAAEAVEQKYPGRFVAMYAYNEHSPPPSIRVHPRVVINVATSFIKGGYTVEQLLEGWRKQGATLGIREYYSVHTWDRDLPGASRGSNLQRLAETIPQFHAPGARFLSAESSDNWGCNGLGYWLAARMLWDVKEAERVAELQQDFLSKAFGPAKKPMEEFYRLIDGSQRSLLSDDLVGRMYRQLAEARRQADSVAIRRRIDDLIVYTRYVDLWLDYESSQGDHRQAAYEQLIKHAYHIRNTSMIHTLALVRDLANRDKAVTLPAEAADYRHPERNPWMAAAGSEKPFENAEIEKLLASGIERRNLLDFTPVSFSDELVPATALKLPPVAKRGNHGIYLRGVRNFFTWLAPRGEATKAQPAEIKLKATGGLIYNTRGPAKIDLYPAAEVEGKAVAQAEVSPNKTEQDIMLRSSFAGLHRLEISDRGAGTRVDWLSELPATILSSPQSPAQLYGRWELIFYVPRGTPTIGLYANGPGKLLDAEGKLAFEFPAKPGYYAIPVPQGQDGRLWRFAHSAGQRLLMTVPPCLARDDKELLLPAEVVQRDAK